MKGHLPVSGGDPEAGLERQNESPAFALAWQEWMVASVHPPDFRNLVRRFLGGELQPLELGER
jgi:hypothetical protein